MIAWAAHRPAVVWATAAALVLAGVVAVQRLPVATKPYVELPRLSVSMSWPGASAELVETYLGSPIEAAIQSVRGIQRIGSESGVRSSGGALVGIAVAYQPERLRQLGVDPSALSEALANARVVQAIGVER